MGIRITHSICMYGKHAKTLLTPCNDGNLQLALLSEVLAFLALVV